MTLDAWITLAVIFLALILFITEWLSIDLVALGIVVALVVGGVISPSEGIAGFSNSATITVLFMFMLSHALLETGALQELGRNLSGNFEKNFKSSLFKLLILIALASAFLNNTPIVAVFIPVFLQIASASGHSPKKMLIPLSFATILGGTCSLIGTSTNLVVDGIAENAGVESLSMWTQAPIGLVTLAGGLLFMWFAWRLLPKDQPAPKLEETLKDYLTEIELLPGTNDDGVPIMRSALIKEYGLDVLSISRNSETFTLPPGDMALKSGDRLKVRSALADIQKMKQSGNAAKNNGFRINQAELDPKEISLVEIVVTQGSELDGTTLADIDLRRRFRAAALAIRHREEVLHDDLYQTKLIAGDVILVEVKTHFIDELKKLAQNGKAPFAVLTQTPLIDFKKKEFYLVIATFVAVIGLATLGIVDILIGSIAGTLFLAATKTLKMTDAYRSVNWDVIFLLAGAFSLGTAMHNAGLDVLVAELIKTNLGAYGPVVILSGLYLTTSILTEIMSNNATAALLTPVAIALAATGGWSVTPFLIAIAMGASASFATPIGYQTNAMVYAAGNYKFKDFLHIGVWMNLIAWIIATLFIPLLYPF